MAASKTNIDMLNGPLGRKILKFAIPIALSSIFQQMFNLADVAVVGQFAGDKALAAVGANTFVINMLINLFVGISVGANVVVANSIGAHSYRSVTRSVHTSQLPLRDPQRPHVGDGGVLQRDIPLVRGNLFCKADS